MRFLKRVRSKRVIAVVLSMIVAFCSALPSYANTKSRSNTNNKRIETSIRNDIELVSQSIRRESSMRNNRNMQGKRMMVKATAYTNDPITSTGTRPTEGRTIAVDPKVIPYGTRVYIPKFNRVFIAEDCGSAIKGNRIDIYLNSYSKCMEFGIQDIEIVILD